MFTLYYKQRSFRLYNHGSEKSMKRALIITTVSGFVPQFEMNNVRILQNLGYEVHYAANYHMPVYTDNNERLEGTGIIQHQIDFVRSPYKIGKNIKALNQLVSLMRETKFHLVHCHTPMGGVLGRIAAHKTNTKPVIYTAHGFHFYKGAPVWNWLFFYPVERFLAHWTDCLITINKEDFQVAHSWNRKKNFQVSYIPGVGVDTKQFYKLPISKEVKRKQLFLPQQAFVFISIGELTKRKNHKVVLSALSKCQNKNFHYLLCGTGPLKDDLYQFAIQLNIQEQVHFLDYRTDIAELLSCSDCFIFPSKQEGLSLALMEAMSVGLPIICSNIRGNHDLVLEKKNGLLVSSNNPEEYATAMKFLFENRKLQLQMSENNKQRVQNFSVENVTNKMKELYGGFCKL